MVEQISSLMEYPYMTSIIIRHSKVILFVRHSNILYSFTSVEVREAGSVGGLTHKIFTATISSHFK